MNWDPFQRQALAELGHRLYRLRGNGPPPGFDAVEPIPPPGRPANPGRPAPSAPAPSAPAPSGATGDDPLLRALMRAAGGDALPRLDLDALRRDPAAKRALWPRLRALRGTARAR